jgi:hypothetical protein
MRRAEIRIFSRRCIPVVGCSTSARHCRTRVAGSCTRARSACLKFAAWRSNATDVACREHCSSTALVLNCAIATSPNRNTLYVPVYMPANRNRNRNTPRLQLYICLALATEKATRLPLHAGSTSFSHCLLTIPCRVLYIVSPHYATRIRAVHQLVAFALPFFFAVDATHGKDCPLCCVCTRVRRKEKNIPSRGKKKTSRAHSLARTRRDPNQGRV